MDDETLTLHSHTLGFLRRVAAAMDMTRSHVDAHGGYVAWSGGKDSTVVAHLACRVRPGTPVVTYVAGTEYPEVLPYCRRVAAAEGWRWEAIQTGDVTDLLDQGVRPASDGVWWDVMIAGPARVAHGLHGRGLLWGLRADESATRAAMLHSTRGEHVRADGVATCAPLWRWRTVDVLAYLHAHRVELCPVYERMAEVGMPVELRRVGRIVGRRRMEERMRWLQRGWPDVHAAYGARWPFLLDSAPEIAARDNSDSRET